MVLVASVGSLFVMDVVIPRLPRALAGGTLWWLGIVLVKETFLDILAQHSHKFDVLIVVIMSMVMFLKSFLEGLGIGLLLSVLWFMFTYSSSLAVVRNISDGIEFQSNAFRPLAHHELLDRLGHRIVVCHAEGYLMFSTTPVLRDKLLNALSEQSSAVWVVLNFSGVRGLDYSAIMELARLGQRATVSGKQLILTELRGNILNVLQRLRVPMSLEPTAIPGLTYIKHYQIALKLCEDQLLQDMGFLFKESSPNLFMETFGHFLEGDALERMEPYFEKAEFPKGTTLFSVGDPCAFAVWVARGELHALRPTRGGEDRLIEIIGVGSFAGFMNLLSNRPYPITVVVPDGVSSCFCFVLRWARLEALLEEEPKIANYLLQAVLRRQAKEYSAFVSLVVQT